MLLRVKLYVGSGVVGAVADRVDGTPGVHVTSRDAEHLYLIVVADSLDDARRRLAWNARLRSLLDAPLTFIDETEADK